MVKYVSLSYTKNLEYLKEFVDDGKNSYCPKMENILNEVSIEYHMTNASLPELEVVSRIASFLEYEKTPPINIGVHGNEEKFFTAITENVEHPSRETMKDLLVGMTSHIYNVGCGIGKHQYLYPIGIDYYDANCVFRGMSILTLAGGDLSKITKLIDGYTVEPAYPDDMDHFEGISEIHKAFDELFYQAILTAWQTDLSENRLRTYEWLIKNRYYTNANPVVVRQLSFPGCRYSANFIDATEKLLNTRLSDIAYEYVYRGRSILKGSKKREIEIELSCYTTVYTFYHILIFNRKYVINQQPINTLLNSRIGYIIPDSTLNELDKDVVGKYASEMGEAYGKFADDPAFTLLKKNELLPGIAGICYDVRFPLSELDTFIDNIGITNSEVDAIKSTCETVKEVWKKYESYYEAVRKDVKGK
jgi:hypothetical protein